LQSTKDFKKKIGAERLAMTQIFSMIFSNILDWFMNKAGLQCLLVSKQKKKEKKERKKNSEGCRNINLL
jgi:hypothetical protein